MAIVFLVLRASIFSDLGFVPFPSGLARALPLLVAVIAFAKRAIDVDATPFVAFRVAPARSVF